MEAQQFVTDLMTEEENVTSVADYAVDERRSLDTFATDRFAREEDGATEKSYLDDDEVSLRSSEGSVSAREKRDRQQGSSMETPTKASRSDRDETASSVGVSSDGDEETKEVTARRTRAARRVK
jgi:hypothetical protein